MQLVAADDVAATVAELAVGAPVGGRVELGGPKALGVDAWARRLFAATGDDRTVVGDAHVLSLRVPVEQQGHLANVVDPLGPLEQGREVRQPDVLARGPATAPLAAGQRVQEACDGASGGLLDRAGLRRVGRHDRRLDVDRQVLRPGDDELLGRDQVGGRPVGHEPADALAQAEGRLRPSLSTADCCLPAVTQS